MGVGTDLCRRQGFEAKGFTLIWRIEHDVAEKIRINEALDVGNRHEMYKKKPDFSNQFLKADIFCVYVALFHFVIERATLT